jgi:hypothetical protein
VSQTGHNLSAQNPCANKILIAVGPPSLEVLSSMVSISRSFMAVECAAHQALTCRRELLDEAMVRSAPLRNGTNDSITLMTGDTVLSRTLMWPTTK